MRERNLFTDDRYCLIAVTLIDRAEITRDINMCRAFCLTRDQCLLTRKILSEDTDFVTDRTGRTYFHAGSAESAVRFREAFPIDDDMHSSVNLCKFQSADAS